MADGSRAPHGARGLKYIFHAAVAGVVSSRPAWGAWIEIRTWVDYNVAGIVAPRMGRVD